jgi:hypothetical protein
MAWSSVKAQGQLYLTTTTTIIIIIIIIGELKLCVPHEAA